MSAILLIIGLSAVFWFFVKLSVNLVDGNKNKSAIKTGSRYYTNKRRHNEFTDDMHNVLSDNIYTDPSYSSLPGNIYNDDSRR